MSILFGDKKVKYIYIGTQKVKEIYIGINPILSNSSPVAQTITWEGVAKSVNSDSKPKYFFEWSGNSLSSGINYSIEFIIKAKNSTGKKAKITPDFTFPDLSNIKCTVKELNSYASGQWTNTDKIFSTDTYLAPSSWDNQAYAKLYYNGGSNNLWWAGSMSFFSSDLSPQIIINFIPI